MNRKSVMTASCLQLALSVVLLLSAGPLAAQIERVSVAADGSQASADSYQAAISDDGSVIAFRSNAANLVAGDGNSWTDIFVRDLSTGTTERVSFQPDGSETSDFSHFTGISDDGNRVVYEGKNSGSGVVITAIHERATGTTVHLLPRYFNGKPIAPITPRLEPHISGDGRFVAFHSFDTFQDAFPEEVRPPDDDFNRTYDIYVFDWNADPVVPLERVSRDSNGNVGRGDSLAATLSDDGRIVAFHSFADDLVAGDTSGKDSEDVFVRDRQTDLTELISQSTGGDYGDGDSYNARVSGDGNVVVFRSQATNLVADDTNGHWDIFARDRSAGTTERVSMASDGTESNHHSFEASVSDDGRYVVFRSNASNLVPDDSNQRFDIFVHDRSTGATSRVSVPSGGGEADGHSYEPDISGDGNWIVFESDATNLVADDTNQARDIFRVTNPL